MRIAVATVLVLFSGLLAACDPTTKVTFVNETEEVVTIWEGSAEMARLAPGQQESYVFGKLYVPFTLRVTDPRGKVLFERSLTWDELQDLDRVVVTEDSP